VASFRSRDKNFALTVHPHENRLLLYILSLPWFYGTEDVMRVALLLVTLAVVFLGVSITRAGQATDWPAVYTPEQAEAGRLALKTNSFGACTDCHTTALTGRNGEVGELPSVSSLPEDYQKMINVYSGKIPALVGPEFLKRWAARTTKDLSKEFQERFGDLREETRLNLIAYILQANGALPGTQPLTAATDVQIRNLAPIDAPNQK
jgi:cytochrome c553